jgi:tripeptide aminopeptidase
MYHVSEKRKALFQRLLSLEQVGRLLKFIEDDQRRSIEEQKELTLIEAPTGHEDRRAQVFADKLRALGLENVHRDRGGNVVALRCGSGRGPKVLIEGHLDTVFPFGTVKSVEERDGFLYAPGIGDDTRALAMLLSLVRGLAACGVETEGDVLFVGTTREEGMGGLGGMKDFLEDNGDIDISLSVDNNDMSAIVYQATVSGTWEFTFHGKGGHAYGAFGELAQPLHAAARAVAQIADFQVPTQPKTTFCVSNFHGGSDAGVHAIAAEASIKVNLRSNSADEFAQLKKKVFDAVQRGAATETARWGKNEITVTSRQLCDIPGGSQDPHMPLVEGAWMALDFLGVEPSLAEGGSTNANRAIGKGIPALCLGRAYAPDENSRQIHNHSLDEKYPVKGAFKAVQLAALMLLMAAGVKGETGSIMDEG